MSQSCVFIFGPTASGKTSLAIFLAQKLNGVIINADSRQVYTKMPIITAMPSEDEFIQAEHRLFNFLEPAEKITVDKYIHLAKKEINKVLQNGKLPIICGGTGFYLKILEEGISPIPVLEDNLLSLLNKRTQLEGIENLHRELYTLDAEMAKKLSPNDSQRIVRALGVCIQTGQTMTAWQNKPKEGGLNTQILKIALNPERDWLYNRIHKRYDIMLKMGLMHEMESLLKEGYNENTHSIQSCGAKELLAYLQGEITENKAKEALLQSTRNYAKRQFTWLKGQFKPDMVFESVAHAQNALSEIEQNLNKN